MSGTPLAAGVLHCWELSLGPLPSRPEFLNGAVLHRPRTCIVRQMLMSAVPAWEVG